MNEIVITGSTGVIGRRAVREVLAAGHRVSGVTRSAPGLERLESLGARAVEADVFDEASLRRAFAGADAVVNLLTKNPPEYYDIALRDFGLMLAALTLGRLSLAVVPARKSGALPRRPL